MAEFEFGSFEFYREVVPAIVESDQFDRFGEQQREGFLRFAEITADGDGEHEEAFDALVAAGVWEVEVDGLGVKHWTPIRRS